MEACICSSVSVLLFLQHLVCVKAGWPRKPDQFVREKQKWKSFFFLPLKVSDTVTLLNELADVNPNARLRHRQYAIKFILLGHNSQGS